MRHGPARAIGTLFLAGAVLGLSGCGSGVAPRNGLLRIANLSSADATFQWQTSGMYGATGGNSIARCSLFALDFGPGDQRLTITTGTGPATFTLSAPSSGQVVLWLVIGSDGTVRQATAADAPPSPYCGG